MFSVIVMSTLFLIAGVASHSSGENDMATFFSQENGTYLYHIKRNDLFLVGVSKYEASSITAVEFLSRWVIKQLGKTWLKDIYSYHKYTNWSYFSFTSKYFINISAVASAVCIKITRWQCELQQMVLDSIYSHITSVHFVGFLIT